MVVEEIQQADNFKEGLYTTMVKVDHYCAPSLSTAAPLRAITHYEMSLIFHVRDYASLL